MVTVTVYVEGSPINASGLGNNDVLTIDNSILFREAFYKLLSPSIQNDGINLTIKPIGSISHSNSYLRENQDAVLLVDLDCSNEDRPSRLEGFYLQEDWPRIFFMVREMEAWFLSQPEVLDIFCKNEGLQRERQNESISSNSLIRDKHPEQIEEPSGKLETLFRQYFKEPRKNKKGFRPRNYSKSKDAPKILILLNLPALSERFSDVKKLLNHINKIIP